MSPDTIIFPYCGLTYQNVADCAGMRIPAAARRLGIAEETLRKRLKDYPELSAQFVRPARAPSKISRRQLLYYARCGYTIKDTAIALGYSYIQTRRRIVAECIRDRFPNQAEGRWLVVRGYAR